MRGKEEKRQERGKEKAIGLSAMESKNRGRCAPKENTGHFQMEFPQDRLSHRKSPLRQPERLHMPHPNIRSSPGGLPTLHLCLSPVAIRGHHQPFPSL